MFVIGLFLSLNASYLSCRQVAAAEIVEFHFENMTIPISVDDLSKLGGNSKFLGKKDTDLGIWLNMLGFKSRSSLSKFLKTPLVREKGMSHQLLKSWAGRRLLDEISDLIIIDNDKTGTNFFNTLEILLDKQKEVSALDLLQAIPGDVIHFDLDEWIQIAKNWRDELTDHKKLLAELRDIPLEQKKHKNNYEISEIKNESSFELLKLAVSHRNEPLQVEVWYPPIKTTKRKNWIVFMSGLGGNKSQFRWLSKSLSAQGWPVVALDHPGSDAKALNLLKKGNLPFPGGEELFTNRLYDLMAVIDSKQTSKIKVGGEKVVLIGHSIGALTAFLASGAKPQPNLEVRCKKALEGLSITNLSRLLQCQLVDVTLPDQFKITELESIVGINSFGSLLWPSYSSANIDVPIFLVGGTFDLITPARSEQLGLLKSVKPNSLSRALVIEGASHFSAVRVAEKNKVFKQDDLFKLDESLVGSDPYLVQKLLSSQIIKFLHNIEIKEGLVVSINNIDFSLRFHLLDYSILDNIVKLDSNSLPLDL